MTTPRFKPVRAGIIGIWDYAEQEFRFADGRLVLRGPNGSGKTKALEVLVPFVLDGSIDARRLDPFSAQQRTMRSNLLYGDQNTGHGYCWLEFARGDERVTIGVGLRAQEQRQEVKTWFFVTDRTVGEDLHLLDHQRVPLTQRALREHLGDAHVFEHREKYRDAVDRRLFGLGPDRYRAMIELILTLRRPQLAKDLDPEALSDVLSDGLRTVDRELLRTSAQAFDNLEAAQRDLVELERAARAVSDLLVHWRTYLRARARRRVEDVRERAERVRATEQEIARAEQHIQRKAREAAEARARRDQHAAEVRAQVAVIESLQKRDAYQNRGQLEDARAGVADAERAVEGALAASRRNERMLASARKALTDATARRDDARARADESRRQLAARLGLAGLPTEIGDDSEAVRARIVARGAAVDAVLEHLDALERAQRDLQAAEAALQQATAAAERAQAAHAEAQAALDELLSQAAQALRAWHAALPERLAADLPLEPLLDAAAGLGRDADLPAMARDAWQPLADDARDRRTRLADEQARLDAEIARITSEIEGIRAERDDNPPAPPTRLADRSGRPGAPLWRLVRFRDALSDADEAGLEGALLAAGLLDAWVGPDDAQAEDDVFLRAMAPVTGPSLADVLVPESDAPADEALTRAVLASISLEDAEIAVLPDGRFRLGPLAGAHRPPHARYIGATARARHRAERIARLEGERDELRRLRGDADAARAACDELLEQIRAAMHELPDPAPARRAWTRVARAQGTAEQAERTRADADQRRSDARRQRDEARRRLHGAASEHGTPAEPDAIRALRAHVDAARAALADFVGAAERLADRERETERAQHHADQSAQAHDEALEALRDARSLHDDKATRLEQLMTSLGAEVEEIVARLGAAGSAKAAAESARDEAAEQEADARRAQDRFDGERGAFAKQLPDQRDDLARAEAALAPFQDPSVQEVLGVAAGDEPFAERLTAAVEAASFTDEQLKTTETRLNNRLEGLDVELGERFHHVRGSEDGVVVVRVADELGQHGLARFVRRLDDRLETARHLMNEQEQRLFEDHLLGNLCAQLGERIDETRALVRAMDEAMQARRLASGKSLGIAWRSLPDADPARRALLDLLRYDRSFLTAERLAELRRLLSEEVQAARRERPDRDYLAILEEALDYRRWHRFELTLFDAAGQKTRLTRAAHGRLSGGEKAATLHLPLFAAAHAHFRAGDPGCPRLVALDEAFAGIDDIGVPELLRLAAAFDLDWFLTGYDLWVTEPFLPGVMHYDLAHDPISRAVSAWPVLWNGQETVEGEGLAS